MNKKILTILVGIFSMSIVGCGGGNEPADTTKYPTAINISFVGATATGGYDLVTPSNVNQTINFTFEPTDVDPVKVKWVVTPSSTASAFTVAGTQTAKFKAYADGEYKVHAEVTVKKGKIVASNELKVNASSTFKANSDFTKATLKYTDSRGVEQDLYMNTLYKNQGNPHLDSLNEQHVLVVPFGFTDQTKVQTAANIEKIRKTFLGTEDDLKNINNSWTSLKTFYNTSSYGKATFDGQVVPAWCVYDGTAAKFATASGGSQGAYAAEYARNWYIAEYNKTNHGALGADAKPLTYFDADGDGFIDLTWIVYSRNTGSNTDGWWAYVTYTGNGPDVRSPKVKTLGWASIDWMASGCGGYDPHTFIHETGHTFGLDDYYDYNNQWSPMGGVDFMDHNIGDHCMFSKFTLGWTAPLVVNDSAVITLHPGTTTGDCFIIPSPNYNNTAFDEYFMFELMAPIGLAKQDYFGSYQGISGYSQPGIRITHVDARVYQRDRNTYMTENLGDAMNFRIDNSFGGRSGLKSDGDYFPINIKEDGTHGKGYMCLTSLIESQFDESNNWTTNPTYNATNAALFTKGASFSLDSDNGWARTFMPSRSNLWNKAKTITGWESSSVQTFTIDQNCTFNYYVQVLDIKADDTYGYEAKVQITANAY